MNCTNAFHILSVHEVGYQTADQFGFMICAQICNMCNSYSCSQWTCTVLWHCKGNSCGVWHQCHLFLKYEHCGVSHYLSQSFFLLFCEWANDKPFLRSQHSMVANSLTWWFQSLEKGINIILYMTSQYHMSSHTPTTYDINSCHRYVIGIHISHMN